MTKISFAPVLLAAFILAGCSTVAKDPVSVSNPDKVNGKKPALNLTQATAASLADFHKNIAALDKVGKLMGGPTGSDTKIQVGLQSLGGSARVGGGADAKSKIVIAAKGPGKIPKGGVVGALLKTGAHHARRGLAKSAALIPDTSWFVLDDSAGGSIYQLREYGEDSGDRPYTGKDSTAYRFPYDEADPVVLATVSTLAYADGGTYQVAYEDLDGDGVLNGADVGKTDQIKRIITTVNHDTTYKSEITTDHGTVKVYDQLGEGTLLSSVDSTFIAGKSTGWYKTQDGDGDGVLNTSASGPALIEYASSWFNDDGTRSFYIALYGPGPDKDYGQPADNLCYHNMGGTLNASGDTLTTYGSYDDDGDGILNGASVGKTVRIRKTYSSHYGDTLYHQAALTDHGNTFLYDSLGDGEALSSADTVWIKGKITGRNETRDGDGDGFLNTAANGGEPIIKTAAFGVNEDGSQWYAYNVYDPGADKDFSKWEDNGQYPSFNVTLSAKGDTLSRSDYGDADGDGLYFSGAAGAANKVWVTNHYFNQNGYKTYRDSVVQFVHDLTIGDDDQITYYSAAAHYDDGSTSLITTNAKHGKDVFGEKDTVEVKEIYTYTGYVAKDADDHTGDKDSAVIVTWMIPNDLGTNDDDEVVYWSHKDYYKKSLSTLFSSEVFTAKVPVLAGQEPEAGVMVKEERYTASAEHDVSKWFRREEFDKAKGTSAWHDVSYYVRGDSSYEDGGLLAAGVGTYARNPDADTRNTGWYNSNTNEFKDTTLYLGAKGTDPAKDISWGTYKDEDGTGDYTNEEVLANGDTSMSRTIKVKKGEDQFVVTEISAADTNTYETHKDTTLWTQPDSSGKTKYSSVLGDDGSYTVLETTLDTDGKTLATGEFTFFPDGSGSGSIVAYADGKAQAPVNLKFDPDGTTYVEGVKVPSAADLAAGAVSDASPKSGASGAGG